MSNLSKKDYLSMLILDYLKKNQINLLDNNIPDFTPENYTNDEVWNGLCLLEGNGYIEASADRKCFKDTTKLGRDFLESLQKEDKQFCYWLKEHCLEIISIILLLIIIFLMVK